MQELRVALRAGGQLRDRLVGLDGASERLAVGRRELPSPAPSERPGVALRPVEIGRDRRAVGRRVEVGEVPLGQGVDGLRVRPIGHKGLRHPSRI